MYQNTLRKWTGYVIQPIAKKIASLGITANMLTIIGLFFGIGAGISIALGHLKIASVLILIGGSFDMMDGAVARATNKNTPFGALLDSVVDRYSEGTIFLGIAIYFFTGGMIIGIALTCLALIGAFLVSYVRARAEGLDLECKVGIMQRPERVIILFLGVILQAILAVKISPLILAMWILVIFSHITILQRVAFASKQFQDINA
ncbi:MAG: CDP-alcohol phosphatidyltransferase family protein [bacterium]